jgi:DNA polymerase III subunit gamma/tau
MSLDIAYRPRVYADVLGQEATIAILKEYVRSGRGFQQSYLFCGGFGSGKTTLGRILARALLCESPKDGEPCDQCHSCLGFLNHGTSADFVEVDAATNSGKADITKITDEVAYATFSGKRRIYLFDESHQLSKDALDALLKYLEDTFPGSEDKKLTCIFCTTEPEKMRATILSRCAPAFMIQPQKPVVIATRLAAICEKEGIVADLEMLTLIAEITECHIRDAMKAVEGVSMLGSINRENVTSYLHLDLNTSYIELLSVLDTDLSSAMTLAKGIMQQVSPVTCYTKLTEVAMLAFQVSLGDTTGTGFWNQGALQKLATKGMLLLGYAARFAARPGRPTAAMLLMDLASLHHGGHSPNSTAMIQVVKVVESPQVLASPSPVKEVLKPVSEVVVTRQAVLPEGAHALVAERDKDWVVDQRLVKSRAASKVAASSGVRSAELSPSEFAMLLGKHLIERLPRGPA